MSVSAFWKISVTHQMSMVCSSANFVRFFTAIRTSFRHAISDFAQTVAHGNYLAAVVLLTWTLDHAGAPPRSMQKALLFGTLDPVTNDFADPAIHRNTPLPLGADRISPDDSFNAEHHWVCGQCTLVNDKRKRRKCEACLVVDPSRPIKRRRSM